MKYPQLVPDRVCTTPITVYREGGAWIMHRMIALIIELVFAYKIVLS